MTNTWWFVWVVLTATFLIPSLLYGWLYRGWGPPLPRLIQRRLGRLGSPVGTPVEFDDRFSWGWAGTLFWFGALLGTGLALRALWWP
ncbi:MAG: hypothetical protein IPG45_32120 [Deltaproteobacteria bacterium]|jgi:hypothetical protein|nr:hypothetical protein [Deltaproteobacteria bacterium]